MAGAYGMRPYIRGADGVGGRSKSAEQIYAERKRGEGPAARGSRFRRRRNHYGTTQVLPSTELGEGVPATLLFPL